MNRIPLSAQTSALIAAFFFGVSIASALAHTPCPVCPACPPPPACPLPCIGAEAPLPPPPEVQDAIKKALDAIQAAEQKMGPPQ
jgi:hypothetical protein